jgi:hypothetical protein
LVAVWPTNLTHAHGSSMRRIPESGDNPEVGKFRRAILFVIRQLGNRAVRPVEFKLLPMSHHHHGLESAETQIRCNRLGCQAIVSGWSASRKLSECGLSARSAYREVGRKDCLPAHFSRTKCAEGHFILAETYLGCLGACCRIVILDCFLDTRGCSLQIFQVHGRMEFDLRIEGKKPGLGHGGNL